MSPIETIFITAGIIAVFSIVSIFIRYQKKPDHRDEYTYWFTNVDELL